LGRTEPKKGLGKVGLLPSTHLPGVRTVGCPTASLSSALEEQHAAVVIEKRGMVFLATLSTTARTGKEVASFSR